MAKFKVGDLLILKGHKTVVAPISSQDDEDNFIEQPFLVLSVHKQYPSPLKGEAFKNIEGEWYTVLGHERKDVFPAHFLDDCCDKLTP